VLTAQPKQAEGTSANGTNGSPSVARRILMTLEACAAQKRSLTLVELVDETGLAKTTLHRTCWKLVELGLLEHSDEGFFVGVKMFALGNSNPILNELRVAAMPLLLELQRTTGAMSNLAILHDGKALIIDALYTAQPPLPRLVGASLPLHCTAVGKAIAANLEVDEREELVVEHGLLPAATWRTIVRPALLREHLDQVAEKGVASSNEEFMTGICGVAAAIKVRGGATVAIGYVGHWNKKVIAQVSEPVLQAAAALRLALA
jgi:DNA-binding IclR family transcriptional regulator